MIVHLSTYQGGGAGIAARRLHEGLLSQDVDSRFVAAIGSPNSKGQLEILPKKYPRFWHRAARKFGLCRTPQEKWDSTCRALHCTDVPTSSVEADTTLLNHPSVSQASILHLHWVAGILPWRRFFEWLRSPVVWTLHDMNPFLGIFHYETDFQRSSTPAKARDYAVRRQKQKLLNDTKPVIVAPSKWLFKKAKSSALFEQFEHRHIPYGIDVKVFKQYQRGFSRSVFNLPTDKKLLLIVAERLSDYRKGYDLLVDALHGLEADSCWEVVAIGEGDVPIENLRYHRLGTIHDERLMALAYSSVDLTVVPSREDNLPNVILESLCCGTPVVGTPAGGIPEPITAGQNGFIADSISPESLCGAIRQAISWPFDRGQIARTAADRYDSAVQATQYQELYNRMIANSM